jgi:hypothetical protein
MIFVRAEGKGQRAEVWNELSPAIFSLFSFFLSFSLSSEL